MKRRDLIKIAAIAPFVGLSFEKEDRILTPQIIEEIGDKLLPKRNKASKVGKPGKIENYDALLDDFVEHNIKTEKQLIDLIKINLNALMEHDKKEALAGLLSPDGYYLTGWRRFKNNETPFFYNHTGLMRGLIVSYGNLSRYGIKQVGKQHESQYF